MLRHPLLLVPVTLLAASLSGCLGCAGEPEAPEPAIALGQRFPAQAARIVDARAAFVESRDGFEVAKDTPDAPPEGRAGLDALLPRAPEGAVRFQLPSGFSVRVRERGLTGGGARAGQAVAYARAGGTSFWTATPNDFEEWLAIDAGIADGREPVATWDIEGATIRRNDEGSGEIEILDDAGLPRIRVQAREAFTASGARIEPRLTVRGGAIELWADAGGEAVLIDPSWTATSNMVISRGKHVASLLPDGRLFVTGGVSYTGACGVSGSQTSLLSTETYDTGLQIWTSKAAMATSHFVHTSTVLQNGKVLIAGGFQGACTGTPTAAAQLYDPGTNTWSAVPSMGTARGAHTATLLPSGKVLVAGGTSPAVTASTEIYDPGTNTWSAGPPMITARTYHFAARLLDGRVFIGNGHDGSAPLVACEIYDPVANTWTAAAPLLVPSIYQEGVAMGDGRVLATGGWINQGGMPVWQTAAEAYDPAANTWTLVASMVNSRSSHKMVLLGSGRVLVAGGESAGQSGVVASELYDPATNTWASGGSMPLFGGVSGGQPHQTLTLLQSGKAIASGGFQFNITYKSTSIFDEGILNGAGCALASDCASGFCVDGVCCNSACAAGACDACSAALGASQNGICTQLTGNACNDSNPCTQTDTCQNGVCTGGNPVVCAAQDSCHSAGACNNITGVCSNPQKANGTACNDGNACTQTDTCQGGACSGANPIMCAAADACHNAGVCDPATGACSAANKPNGTACTDGNACTINDTCQNGACTGGSAVICSASDSCHDPGVCNPATGACSNPQKVNGSACNDGNACTQTDTCQNGACSGGNPVVCAAPDACHNAGVCDPVTGACSFANKANGTACNDGNACTQTDTCQNGVCSGANPVTCVASDSCHDPGACNAATGACSNPLKANGSACNDGNPCTQTDTCQGGACTGGNPVSCAAPDACHDPGVCNPATGACAYGNKPNGTGCTAGNGCSQTDTCQNGVCTAGNPVICPAPDACHNAGVCDPMSGSCVYTTKANGTACNDGNGCTQSDTCQSGVCTGGNPVVCAAPDACHTAGACNPATGVCSNPSKANGTACDDGNACTQTDTCQSGACTGGNPVVCAAPDACHLAGACDAASGSCIYGSKPNGAACSDGNACTQTDTCQNGACTSGSPVICPFPDACHNQGACNPATGACGNPQKPNGSACDDGDACTQTDTCQAGACAGSNPVVCPMPDACHLMGACNAQTGLCSSPAKSDGTACSDGNACTLTDTCQAGACVPGSGVVCAALDECHAIGACDPVSGMCSNPAAADGLPCSGGVCAGGACVTVDAGTDGGTGGAGGSGTGGAGTTTSGTGGTGGSSTTTSGTGGGAGGSSTTTAGTGGSGGSSATTSGAGGSSTTTSGAGGSRPTTASSASSTSGDPGSTGGCGCEVAGSRSTGGLWVGLGLLLALRRRRAAKHPA